MNLAELERALRAGADCETWVERLAAYFDSHELCYGHGTDNAVDEAYWLVRGVQAWESAAWEAPPASTDLARVLEIAKARVEQRKPLAYLLGEAWFAGLRFELDAHVPVPRSPLAELIEAGLAPWCTPAAGDRLLDIGTGSGCLAIAAAHHCPQIEVVATDVSPDALAIAAANAAALGFAGRVRFIEADLYPPAETPFEIVICNPPYVPTARLAELPPEYADEPVGALDGGPTGLEVVARLLAQAPAHLAPGGCLIVEVGESQAAFSAAYSELAVTWLEFERGGEGVFVATREQLTGTGHLAS